MTLQSFPCTNLILIAPQIPKYPASSGTPGSSFPQPSAEHRTGTYAAGSSWGCCWGLSPKSGCCHESKTNPLILSLSGFGPQRSFGNIVLGLQLFLTPRWWIRSECYKISGIGKSFNTHVEITTLKSSCNKSAVLKIHPPLPWCRCCQSLGTIGAIVASLNPIWFSSSANSFLKISRFRQKGCKQHVSDNMFFDNNMLSFACCKSDNFTPLSNRSRPFSNLASLFARQVLSQNKCGRFKQKCHDVMLMVISWGDEELHVFLF